MKKNPFKAALQANKQLIGCWVGTASPYLTEIYASIGFDWLALDGEHGPNDLRTILGQLQAMAGYDSAPVVRLPHGDATRIKHLEEICAVDGVDGVFFGPDALAASMGLILEPGHPSVKAAVEEGMKLVLSRGKAAGILTADKAFAQRCLDLGAQFVAVGVDTLMIVNSARALLQQYR